MLRDKSFQQVGTVEQVAKRGSEDSLGVLHTGINLRIVLPSAMDDFGSDAVALLGFSKKVAGLLRVCGQKERDALGHPETDLAAVIVGPEQCFESNPKQG